MKYAVILPDGAADLPVPQLDGRTPLEVAKLPNMNWVAMNGRLGRVPTIPDGFVPGTDVATLAVLGYDPRQYYSGRAPIEAAAKGLTIGPDQIVFRCNFVTIEDGRMRDFTAGHIATSESEALIADLNELVRQGDPSLEGCTFHVGVSYRNLMIASRAYEFQLQCAPPHDIPDQPVVEHLPRGNGEQRARGIMARAESLLREHRVNQVRRQQGKAPVTGIWLWGQGRPRRLEPFAEKFGVRGAVITGVDIIRGLAVLTGMTLIEVPGATGYLDTDYVGKGAAAVRALDDHDLVIVHVEAPDEAGHLGDAAEKVKALERVDEHVVAPLLAALRRHGAWRMLIAPDHPTPVTTTAHSAVPPPFCFAGSDVPVGSRRQFNEREAETGGFFVEPAHRLMEIFLRR